MAFQYDLAISFAGDDRRFARYIADGLRGDCRVFFDEFEKAELWGSDLSESLPDRYLSSRYCVMLISKEYVERVWTTLERQAIIFEFLKRRGKDYVLPIVVRGGPTTVPGLSGLTGYLTVREEVEWPGVVDMIRQKLAP